MLTYHFTIIHSTFFLFTQQSYSPYEPTSPQVYGDGSSPALHQLSPLPDTWTPAKTPGPDTPGKGVWTPALEDCSVAGSELLDEDDRDSVSTDLEAAL